MKQNITEEQWNEITTDQQVAFLLDNFDEDANTLSITPPSIGKMIEFLGNEWLSEIENCRGTDGSLVIWAGDGGIYSNINELCNDLWSACKTKLKQK